MTLVFAQGTIGMKQEAKNYYGSTRVKFVIQKISKRSSQIGSRDLIELRDI